jgi:DEAD/DEAH box helicase domain-containing protein
MHSGSFPKKEENSQKVVLDHIINSPEFAPNIIVNRLIPAAEASFAPFPAGLAPEIAASLRSRGINPLYTHKVEVWNKTRICRNVIVVIPTVLGKNLCS